MWTELLMDRERRREAARDVAHAIIFLLGCGAVVTGLLQGRLDIIAVGPTLFALIGIARA